MLKILVPIEILKGHLKSSLNGNIKGWAPRKIIKLEA